MPETPLIIHGGKFICPTEIETVLNDHPAVAEAVVVGVPDRFWGQIVAAAVRLSGPTSEAATELTGYCRGQLPVFKVPARWLFVPRLPRTAEGQPCRATLRAHLAMVVRQVTDVKNLRLPQQRGSCGLEGLDYP